MAKSRSTKETASTATISFEASVPFRNDPAADTFRRDLRFNFELRNGPPFNDSDWFRKDDDVPWQFGVPPNGNVNCAWVQHFIYHLALDGNIDGRQMLN